VPERALDLRRNVKYGRGVRSCLSLGVGGMHIVQRLVHVGLYEKAFTHEDAALVHAILVELGLRNAVVRRQGFGQQPSHGNFECGGAELPDYQPKSEGFPVNDG
jgi:hypothetical protein